VVGERLVVIGERGVGEVRIDSNVMEYGLALVLLQLSADAVNLPH
jgi:hypothetical protein